MTQVGDYIVVQYVTTEDEYYGRLLDRQCRVLAEMPDLCDVMDGTLLFDYPPVMCGSAGSMIWKNCCRWHRQNRHLLESRRRQADRTPGRAKPRLQVSADLV